MQVWAAGVAEGRLTFKLPLPLGQTAQVMLRNGEPDELRALCDHVSALHLPTLSHGEVVSERGRGRSSQRAVWDSECEREKGVVRVPTLRSNRPLSLSQCTRSRD
jgi:hypothetical protein